MLMSCSASESSRPSSGGSASGWHRGATAGQRAGRRPLAPPQLCRSPEKLPAVSVPPVPSSVRLLRVVGPEAPTGGGAVRGRHAPGATAEEREVFHYPGESSTDVFVYRE